MPQKLCLSTLNTTQQVVRSALRNQVCDYEQRALDAGKQGDYLAARTYKDWAFAVDMALSCASGAISALFMEALATEKIEPQLRLVERTEFPSLNRSEEDRHLDELQTEVASTQPEPDHGA